MLVCWLTLLVWEGIQAHSYSSSSRSYRISSFIFFANRFFACSFMAKDTSFSCRSPALPRLQMVKDTWGHCLSSWVTVYSHPPHFTSNFPSWLLEWADTRGNNLAQTSPSTPTIVWGLIPRGRKLLIWYYSGSASLIELKLIQQCFKLFCQ